MFLEMKSDEPSLIVVDVDDLVFAVGDTVHDISKEITGRFTWNPVA